VLWRFGAEDQHGQDRRGDGRGGGNGFGFGHV
jgi:hypothetical protein